MVPVCVLQNVRDSIEAYQTELSDMGHHALYHLHEDRFVALSVLAEHLN